VTPEEKLKFLAEKDESKINPLEKKKGSQHRNGEPCCPLKAQQCREKLQ